MKKKLLVCAAVFSLFAAVFVSCDSSDDEESESVTIESIVFDADEYMLTVADDTSNTRQIEATVKPVSAKDSLKWTSTNTDVVVVNDTGLIVAVAAGSAAVYAQLGDKIAVATVVVAGATDSSGGVKGIVVKDTTGAAVTNFSLATEKYRTMQLIPYVTAAEEGATEEKVEPTSVLWASSDESVAVVSNAGLVVALKEGVTGITARVPNTDKFYIATLMVKEYVEVGKVLFTAGTVDGKTSLELDYFIENLNNIGSIDSSFSAPAGTTITLDTKCVGGEKYDKESTNQSIVWQIEEGYEEYATVENGVITLLKATTTKNDAGDDDTFSLVVLAISEEDKTVGNVFPIEITAAE